MDKLQWNFILHFKRLMKFFIRVKFNYLQLYIYVYVYAKSNFNTRHVEGYRKQKGFRDKCIIYYHRHVHSRRSFAFKIAKNNFHTTNIYTKLALTLIVQLRDRAPKGKH